MRFWDSSALVPLLIQEADTAPGKPNGPSGSGNAVLPRWVCDVPSSNSELALAAALDNVKRTTGLVGVRIPLLGSCCPALAAGWP